MAKHGKSIHHRRRRLTDSIAWARSHPMVVALVAAMPVISLGIAVVNFMNPRQFVPGPEGVTAEIVSGESEKGVEGAVYSIPLDVPLATFPSSVIEGCTEEQVIWLEKHGKRQTRAGVTLRLRNNAAGGAQVTVRDVRIVAESRVDPLPSVAFRCPTAGSAEVIPVDLNADTDSPVSRTVADPSGEGTVSGLLAVNLAPGEEALIVLRIYAELKSVVGELAADTVIVDKEGSLKIEGDRKVKLEGSSVSSQQLTVRPADYSSKKQFTCIIGGFSGRYEDCSAADILELANMFSAEAGRPLKRPVSMDYQCSVDSLRWSYERVYPADPSGSLYADPIVHSCTGKYSLVEGGIKGASVFDYFLMERTDSRWVVRLRSGVRIDSDPAQALFSDSELVHVGLDSGELKKQLGSETSSGRKIFPP